MHGGIISDNISAHPQALFNVGGVSNSGRFEMRGGTIKNNIGAVAGGVESPSGNILSPSFIKTGGTIINNTALGGVPSGSAHQVFISPGSLNRSLNMNVYEAHNLNSAVAGTAGGWVE